MEKALYQRWEPTAQEGRQRTEFTLLKLFGIEPHLTKEELYARWNERAVDACGRNALPACKLVVYIFRFFRI